MIKNADPSSGRLVTFDTLIKTLHVNDIHYNKTSCPEDCDQKETCGRIRDVGQLLNDVILRPQPSIFFYYRYAEDVVVLIKSKSYPDGARLVADPLMGMSKLKRGETV